MIIFAFILGCLAVKYNSPIKKRFVLILSLSVITSIVMFFIQDMSSPINSGDLGMAFFILVMFQSAFKKGTLIYQKLLLVRKEYSILGFVFIIPHALLYMFGDYQSIELNGVLSFLIMVPLFITSFIIIRKKMKAQHWRILHFLSYPAYALMFIHVLWVGETGTQLLYALLAMLYLILRIKNNAFSKLNKPVNRIIILLIIFSIISLNVYSFVTKETHSISETAYLDFKDISLIDGTYTGEAIGYKSHMVKVDVIVSNNRVNDIILHEYGASNMKYEKAVEELRKIIIDKQSTNIDVISGASKSSKGLKNAVTKALK